MRLFYSVLMHLFSLGAQAPPLLTGLLYTYLCSAQTGFSPHSALIDNPLFIYHPSTSFSPSTHTLTTIQYPVPSFAFQHYLACFHQIPHTSLFSAVSTYAPYPRHRHPYISSSSSTLVDLVLIISVYTPRPQHRHLCVPSSASAPLYPNSCMHIHAPRVLEQ